MNHMLKPLLIVLMTVVCLTVDGFAADPMEADVGERLVEMFTAGYGRGTDAASEARRIYLLARA